METDLETLELDERRTARVVLGSELRLRDLPRLIATLEGAVEHGARRIELDTTELDLVTEGAGILLETVERDLHERGVVLCWVVRVVDAA